MKVLFFLFMVVLLCCKSNEGVEANSDKINSDQFSSQDLKKIIHNGQRKYKDELDGKVAFSLGDFINDRTISDQPPIFKAIKNELGDNYLIFRHFTGGAHCCSVTEILFEDKDSGDYIFIFEYSKDGDLMDITYPLDYFSYNNYFYSSYAASLTLNCSSDINPVYSLFRKSVTKEYEGDKEVYMNCFKKYLLENNIPELNSEMQDNGERELILNSINLLHLTSVSLDELLDIYISHTNNFRDKERLWLEMLDLIEDKDKSLIERHKKILNSKIATNESREIDKLYYQYKDLDSESFVTSAGEIYFDNSNFQFIFLPESDKVAYIRIGKTQSTERSEIIESFLDESVDVKINNGYKLHESKEEKTKYGTYKRTEYRKGDLYINTYLEHERVQGTYNSTSFLYTYYVELGSLNRRQKFIDSQYSLKLGN